MSKTSVSGLSTDDFAKTDMVVNMAKALVRNTGVGVYVIDYCLSSIIYVSDNIAQRYGMSVETIRTKGYVHYLDYVSHDDYKMLLNINDLVFDFFRNLSSEEILNHTVIYDFYLNNHLVEQHYTPVVLRNGKIWLAMCTISPSSYKQSGHIIIQKTDSSFYYEYFGNSWVAKRVKSLSDVEKSVLRLSARGFTAEETAKKLSRSVDTIKAYRKQIMKKFDADNISEALMFALNHNMI